MKAVVFNVELPFNISLGKLCFIDVAMIFVCPDSVFGFIFNGLFK